MRAFRKLRTPIIAVAILFASLCSAIAANIAFVQSSMTTTAANVSTLSARFNSSVANGSLIVLACIGSQTDAVFNAPSDSVGNTYNSLIYESLAPTIRLYYAKNVTGGSNFTVTCDPSVDQFVTMAVHEYTGADFIAPFVSSKAAENTNTTPNSGSVVTTEENLLYFAFMTHNGADYVITPDGAYNQRAEFELGSCCMPINTQDRIAASGTHSANWTISSSNIWSAGIAVFRPSTGSTPVNVYHYAVGVDSVSVRWDLNTGSSYTMAISSNSNFAKITSSGTGALNQNTTSYAGLISNTTYFFKVKISTDADALYSATASSVTVGLPPTPSVFVSSNVSVSSINFNWSADSYAPGTSYRVRVTTSSDFSTYTTSDTTNVFITTTSLRPNATHYFSVAASPFTSYSSESSTATRGTSPGMASLSGYIFMSSASVRLSTNSNPANTTFRVSASSTGFATVDFTTTGVMTVSLTTLTLSGLQPNTTYSIGSESINWNSLASSRTVISTYTFANTPGASTATAISTGAVTLAWSPNGNPLIPPTSYQVQISTIADFSRFSSSVTFNTFATTTTLRAATTYYFRVAAYNRFGISGSSSAYGPTMSTQTLTSGATSYKTGPWSAADTWAGGYKPGDGSTVLIQTGHTVTLDESATVGNNVTTTAVKLNGTLTWGTPTSSVTLTSRGSVEVLPGGKLNMGGDSYPAIPANKTATLLLNTINPASAYGLSIYDGATLITQGDVVSSSTTLSVAASASDTVLTVNNASEISGWKAGDYITIGKNRRNSTQETEKSTITFISGNQITVAPISFPHAVGARVSNLSRSVVIRGASASNIGFIFNQNQTADANFSLQWTEVAYMGRNQSQRYGVFFSTYALGTIDDSSIHEGFVGLFLCNSSTGSFRNNLIYGHASTALGGVYLWKGSSNTFTGNHIYGNRSYGLQSIGLTSGLYNRFTSNEFYSNDLEGFYADDPFYFTLDNNRAYSNVQHGIHFNNGVGTLVTGNHSFNNGGAATGHGFFVDSMRRSLLSNNTAYSNVQNGFWIGGANNFGSFVFNDAYTNVQQGFYLKTESYALFYGNRGYSNTLQGAYYDGASLNDTVYCQYYGNSDHGLRLDLSNWNRFTDCSFGYDRDGNSASNTSYEFGFELTNQQFAVLRNSKVNSLGFQTAGFNQQTNSILSLKHNQTPGLTQLWGNYRTYGSTLSLEYASDTFISSATAPRAVRGLLHGATVVTIYDGTAVTELITVEFRGGIWHVDGSISGADMVTFSGNQTNLDVPSGQPKFRMDFFQNGTPSDRDRVQFAILAAAGDAGVQKKLLFGKSDAAFNNSHSRLIIDTTGTFKLIGSAAAPSIVDWIDSNSTYYTLLSTRGQVYMNEFYVAHVDTDGFKFSGTPSTVTMRNGTFDFGMLGSSTRTLIQLQNVVASSGSFSGINFGDSETVNKSSPTSVRVTGSSSTLSWTFTNWGGSRGGPTYEVDNGNKIFWSAVDRSTPANISDLTALPGSSNGTVTLNWTSPGDDGTIGDLTVGSEFRIRFSTTQITSYYSPPPLTSTLIISTSATAGSTQGRLVTGLNAGTTWYFAMVTIDPANNISSWTTSGVNIRSSTPSADFPLQPPSGLSALTPNVKITSMTLSWTNPAAPQYSDDRSSYTLFTATYAFVASTDAVVNLSSTVIHPLTQATTVALTPNTTYFFGVVAIDSGTNIPGLFSAALVSTMSAVYSTVTLAAPPLTAVSTFTYVGSSSITAQWVSNGNPPGTLYAVQVSSWNGFSGNFTSSYTYSTQVTTAGLREFSQYYFRVNAVNHRNLNTDYLNMASTTTKEAPNNEQPAPYFVDFDATDGGGQTNVVLNGLVGTQENDILIAVVHLEANDNPVTPPSGFTELIHIDQTAGGYDDHIFWKRATNAEPANYTFSWSGACWMAGYIASYRGAAGNPIDAYGSSISDGQVAYATAPSIVTTVPNTRVLGLFSSWDSPDWTPNGSLVERIDTSGNLNLADFVKTSPGATGDQRSDANLTHWTAGALIALKPAAAAPKNVSYYGVDSGSVSLRWDLTSGLAYQVAISSTSDFSVIASSRAEALNQNTTSFTSLIPNSSYYFKVKGSTRPDDSYSQIKTTVTLAAIPAAIVSTFTGVTTSAITAGWDSNGNSAGNTLYIVDISTWSGFTGTVTSSSTYAVSVTTSGLNMSSPYYFRVKARNQYNLDTSYLNLGYTTTTGAGPSPGQLLRHGGWFDGTTKKPFTW